VSDTIVVMHSDDHPDTVGGVARDGMAVAALCGVLSSLIIAAIAAVAVPAQTRDALLLLAFWMPALACQDFLRYVAFALARPMLALTSDTVWVIGSSIGVLVCAISGTATLASLTGVWAASGGIAAGAALLLARIFPPHVSRTDEAIRGWFVKYRALYPQFTLDFVAQQTNGPLILFIVSALLGPAATGAIRGSQLLFNPLTIFINGSRVAVIPELVRLRTKGVGVWRHRVTQITIGLAAICVAWSVVVLLLPSQIGSAVLGETWAAAEPLLLPMSAVIVGLGVVSGQFAAVRSIADATGSLRARLITAVSAIGGATLGAGVGGALGAVVGMAVAAPLSVIVWGFQLRKSDRLALDRERPSEAASIAAVETIAAMETP
jgi:hypothetical protein